MNQGVQHIRDQRMAREIRSGQAEGAKAKGDAAMAEGQIPKRNSHHSVIRRYRASDREAVRRLVVDCADPRVVPTCLDSNQRLVTDVLTKYYVDFEPEACWVADDPSSGVVGYLLGCLSTARRCRVMASRIVPSILLRAVLTGAAFSCPVGRVARAALRTWRSVHTVKSRATLAYPAHLHIGVHEDHRRRGLARELVLRFIEHVRTDGIPGIHASVVGANLPACALLRNVGFDVLSQYDVIFPGSPRVPVHMLLLGLKMPLPGELRRSDSSSRAKDVEG